MMRRLATTLVFATGLAAIAAETGVQRLENIVAPFPTMAAFLEDATAVKQYEKELARYFGRRRYPCETFSEVMGELKSLQAVHPDLANRLWSMRSASEFPAVGVPDAVAGGQPVRWVSAPRAFHSIWDDLSQTGCPRSDCSAVDAEAPTRWSAALDRADFYRLEKGTGYTGAAIVTVPLQRGGNEIRLVFTARHPLLRAETQEGSSIVQQWGRAAGEEKLRRLGFNEEGEPVVGAWSSNSSEPLASYSSSDPWSDRIAKTVSNRCSAGGKKGFLTAMAKSSGAGGGPTGSAMNPSSPMPKLTPKERNALKEISVNLGGKGAASKSPSEIEVMLRRALQRDPDASRRAQAAYGLTFFARPTVDPGRAGLSTSTLVPSTPVKIDAVPAYPEAPAALARALDDKAPEVRGLASVGLSQAGGPWADLPQIDDSLAYAARMPSFTTSPGSSMPIDTNRVRVDAIRQMLDRRVEVPRESQSWLIDRMKETQDPVDRRALGEAYARAYLEGLNGDGRLARARLAEDLARNPKLVSEVANLINHQAPKSCPNNKDNPA